MGKQYVSNVQHVRRGASSSPVCISPATSTSPDASPDTSLRSALVSQPFSFTADKTPSVEHYAKSKIGRYYFSSQSDVQHWEQLQMNPLRELDMIPNFDLFSRCMALNMSMFASAENFLRHITNSSERGLTNLLPPLVLSPVQSASTSAARALIVGQCAQFLGSEKLRMLSNQFYLEAIKLQNIAVQSVAEGCGNDSVMTVSKDVGPSIEAFANITNGSSEAIDPLFQQDKCSYNSIRALSVSDDCTIAGFLLPFCETMTNNVSVNNWSSLITGVVMLLELGGPQAFREGEKQVMFNGALFMLAIHAAVTPDSRCSILNLPEWRECRTIVNPQSLHFVIIDDLFLIGEHQMELRKLFLNISEPFTLSSTGNSVSFDTIGRDATLRLEYCNEEGWKAMKELHANVTILDLKVEFYLGKYAEQYYDASLLYKGEDLRDVKRDPVTKFPLLEERCPLAKDDADWQRTHFGKPQICYATMFCSRFVTTGFLMRMAIAFIQCYTAPAAYYSTYKDFKESPRDSLLHSFVDRYIDEKKLNIKAHCDVLLRSVLFNLALIRRPIFVYFIFLLGRRCPVDDPLLRGWIWHKLSEVFDTYRDGFLISEIDNEQCRREMMLYRALPTCAGCGERVRF